VTAPSIKWISRDDPPEAFPDIHSALSAPNGLLAAGGDLSVERLLYAYRHCIFPWFDGGQPILWWSPDPRCVMIPGEFHVARRLRRGLRNSAVVLTFNRAFGAVIDACGRRRRNSQPGSTWITPAMLDAYTDLHRQGWAHSVEAWLDDRLVGGMYGLAIGEVFFGESMFSHETDASKIALLALCRRIAAHGFRLLDCQVSSPHLQSLGARLMPRNQFATVIRSACASESPFARWPADPLAARQLLHE
jgi:leucyl/phenylalanyl-tRNA--protein transferase